MVLEVKVECLGRGLNTFLWTLVVMILNDVEVEVVKLKIGSNRLLENGEGLLFFWTNMCCRRVHTTLSHGWNACQIMCLHGLSIEITVICWSIFSNPAASSGGQTSIESPVRSLDPWFPFHVIPDDDINKYDIKFVENIWHHVEKIRKATLQIVSGLNQFFC